ncbi:methylenetetrahydrofolate reductase C-terminal domain-containing protein [Acinetobacter larvae]|uniref:Methylenetetrahydrofolate reductase n=1 Tax=Acinetobacter larvae TaxID=1789224 RepID=A0A1B2LXD2_9GAMM|nr:methylenetetrahydrofolate reductase C-terminal domain-containing protein [Acinetobacter larvae]AOA57590.1 methylenetetrahydrofolate reductase [Acinetobacter larvae]
MSLLATCFAQQQFCVLIEHLCSQKKQFAVSRHFAGFPAVMTLADRVQHDDDPAPLSCSTNYPAEVEKVLHYSGKDRDIVDLQQFLQEAEQAGQQNILFLTGDKLKQHHSGHEGYPRTRYLESVNAIMAAKQYGGFYIGAAVNPFKYTQAEQDAQYYKLHKKIKAGADFFITQLGFDLSALKKLQIFMQQNYPKHALLTCIMPLTAARAHFMHREKVAGIVISSYILDFLAQEKALGYSERVYMRCALQILICKAWGLAGVHLSACHTAKEQQILAHYLDCYRSMPLSECLALWYALWQIPNDRLLQPKVPCYARPASSTEIIQYQKFKLIHRVLFQTKFSQGIGYFIFKRKFWDRTLANKILLKVEHMTKHHAVGCESCGQCRLEETLYICPETCPKGLANGPCGGTYLDRCEFGDRECIHSRKARLAKAILAEDILSEKIIATVPKKIRGSSSWKNWYRIEY